VNPFLHLKKITEFEHLIFLLKKKAFKLRNEGQITAFVYKVRKILSVKQTPLQENTVHDFLLNSQTNQLTLVPHFVQHNK